MYWMNGYEFGLFGNCSTCVLLAQTMQAQGKVYEEVVSPKLQRLAAKHGRHDNIRVMSVIYWDADIVRAFAKRADGHFFLRQGDYNGYEMGLVELPELCARLGQLAHRYTGSISDVVKFNHFKEAPMPNILQFLGI